MSNSKLNEIIEKAKKLPLEYQMRVLDVLKGMAFEKRVKANRLINLDKKVIENIQQLIPEEMKNKNGNEKKNQVYNEYIATLKQLLKQIEPVKGKTK